MLYRRATGTPRRELAAALRRLRPLGFGAAAFTRFASEGWWSQAESNRRPLECHSSALPTELWPLQGSDVSNRSSGKRSALCHSDTDYRRPDYPSSSFSMSPPMMSVTSASSSSCSSMKVSSSSVSSISTSSSSTSASAAAGFFAPWRLGVGLFERNESRPPAGSGTATSSTGAAGRGTTGAASGRRARHDRATT